MRLIFMGTPDFSVRPLERIYESGEDIVLVVTQPDRKKGRGKETGAGAVKECALRLGLNVFQPEKVKDPEAVRVIRELSPDIIVVSAFGQILSKEILEIPGLGCINIHASLLPEYRGASPIQRCIMDGKKETGVTIMQMDEGLDTGDILLQRAVEIDRDETGGSLFEKLSLLGADLIAEALPLIEKGELSPLPQDGEKSSYAGMIKKEMGRLDFSGRAEDLERLIRALDPWPSAYTELNGKVLKIWKAETADIKDPSKGAKPGTVLEVGKDDFTISCGTGALIIKEVQLSGKKRMSAADFLRGVKIVPGMTV